MSHALGCLLLLAGCSANSDSANAGIGVTGHNPWVAGGQTGALRPPCGLTPAARAGDSVPGGDFGIVIHTQACAGFAAAELELRDEAGASIPFVLEPLPGGAMLLRPQRALAAGVYRVMVAGVVMESIVAEQPEALPMQLGTLRPSAPSCGADVELEVDALLLPYLPQLKLSVSVDGGPEQTWFDYGTLDANAGRALLSLPCSSQPCLADGAHTLRVTAHVTVQTRCQGAASASFSADMAERERNPGCGVAPTRRTAASGRGLLALELALGLLAVRRARRSSA
jgi:hypothetical protein